ncbi:hypothetical protein K443DRAFT_423387 [Laccaria amethystina LaAM-08-1]|uniref:WSC domain-containing protein n=1 Tax=Laccaria amethystina LaAM-08-1 TaxID=1095629 RepID=A0A0C9WP93_9AGAR|nr:hypothetical protein K443DRAFT_423387 [Laccaria amethystina LaAM-08-1]
MLSPILLFLILLCSTSTLSVTITQVGCFQDKPEPQRLLNGLANTYGYNYPGSYKVLPKNSQESCGNFCSGLGFKYSGVENADQCFCGNVLPPELVKSVGCQYMCPGNPTQSCGGNNAIQVYELTAAVNPVMCVLCNEFCATCGGSTFLSLPCPILVGMCAVGIITPASPAAILCEAYCVSTVGIATISCAANFLADCTCHPLGPYAVC